MSARFIAEVSSNHHRDLERCLAFIDTAAAIGCAAVKFQLFRVERLFAPEILARSAAHRARADWELPVAFLPALAERCRARRVEFACTPFDLEAVGQLADHVDFYKIASYELLWDALLLACAATGKPVVLSTGMATLDEVVRAVGVLRAGGCAQPTLLHCVSGYPTPADECNLAAIATLREACGCAVGWSDHSVDAAVIARAVLRWGAELVEFHLDLDGHGEEYAAGHCWLPAAIGAQIAELARGERADGDGRKEPVRCELADRNWRADPLDGLRPLRAIRADWQPQP
ncbi:N-acetylneuraminate synthase family protein [Plasticicumulans acidivorans]|uniref:N-acetylneuraminate synthase n=1 Tax=Plasticicumulans acidivorans TaxID=886464 RepID=A0A317MXF1_9GAMM|nr:N-acetylneuraminate synthase family protein [Plasticicumulans acidivorans]PWV63307.1 N-acetylneuraminate synthase [Plasticicumulans acidivorans]